MNKIKRSFSQISEAERIKIEVLLQEGNTKQQIADKLCRHVSSMYREVKRNTAARGIGAKVYNADKAQYKTVLRHKTKHKRQSFSPALKQTVKGCIEQEKLSPELIAGRMKKQQQYCVSAETIYQWIWKCKHGNKRKDTPYKELHKYLKHYGRRQKRRNKKENRGCLKNRISIENRPAKAGKRTRIGDKEMDIVLGKNRKPGLLVLQDRKTRFTRLEKLKGKSAAYIEKKINKVISRFEHGVKTITTDNDLAFANHHQLQVPVYFTHPYSSHEKGSVENRIGVLRRYFPKGTDFDKVSWRQIRKAEQRLNQRPMKIFNYETPSEQYFNFAFIT